MIYFKKCKNKLNIFFLKKKKKNICNLLLAKTFNVISILGEGYSLGVKFNNNVVPLKPSTFPCKYLSSKYTIVENYFFFS